MEEQRETPRYAEYFVLDTADGCWMISRQMAVFIEHELDRWPRPRWIRFVDVVGARVRLRTELIRSLGQSSAEIRSEWRRFYKEREQESKTEKDWDEDE